MTQVPPDRLYRRRLLTDADDIFRSDPTPTAVIRAAETLASRPDYTAMSARGRDVFKCQLGKRAKRQRNFQNMPRVILKDGNAVLRSFTPGVLDCDANVGWVWLVALGGKPIAIRLASPLRLGTLANDDRVTFGGDSDVDAWRHLRAMTPNERLRQSVPGLVDQYGATDWPRGTVVYRPVPGKRFFVLTVAEEIAKRPDLVSLVLARFGLRIDEVDIVVEPAFAGAFSLP